MLEVVILRLRELIRARYAQDDKSWGNLWATGVESLLLVCFLPDEIPRSEAMAGLVCALDAYGVRDHRATTAAVTAIASTAFRSESFAPRRTRYSEMDSSQQDNRS